VDSYISQKMTSSLQNGEEYYDFKKWATELFTMRQ
jgi:hypothetical protein